MFDLSGIQVLDKSPYLNMNCKDTTIESFTIFIQIRNYIRSIYSIKEEFSNISKEILDLKDTIIAISSKIGP